MVTVNHVGLEEPRKLEVSSAEMDSGTALSAESVECAIDTTRLQILWAS